MPHVSFGNANEREHVILRLVMYGAVSPLPLYVLMAWYLPKHGHTFRFSDNSEMTFCL